MKPEAFQPQFNPEDSMSQPRQNVEYRQENSIESSPELSSELASKRAEGIADSSSGLLVPLPMPVVSSVQINNDATTTSATNFPLIANDDDLIEKEWVDRAKKIISQTKDDPYRREQEVGKLQIDYIKKRYGRDIGAA